MAVLVSFGSEGVVDVAGLVSVSVGDGVGISVVSKVGIVGFAWLFSTLLPKMSKAISNELTRQSKAPDCNDSFLYIRINFSCMISYRPWIVSSNI